MLRKLTMFAMLVQSCCGLAVAADQDTSHPYDRNVEDLTDRSNPPMLGIHWSRDFAASRQLRHSNNPLMTYHGGKILTTAVTEAIFWGPSWANSTFVGDKFTGLDSWYTGHSNSNYAKTVDEYTGSNGQGSGLPGRQRVAGGARHAGAGLRRHVPGGSPTPRGGKLRRDGTVRRGRRPGQQSRAARNRPVGHAL